MPPHPFAALSISYFNASGDVNPELTLAPVLVIATVLIISVGYLTGGFRAPGCHSHPL